MLAQDFAFHYPPALRELRRKQYTVSARQFGSLPAFATKVLRDICEEESLGEEGQLGRKVCFLNPHAAI